MIELEKLKTELESHDRETLIATCMTYARYCLPIIDDKRFAVAKDLYLLLMEDALADMEAHMARQACKAADIFMKIYLKDQE